MEPQTRIGLAELTKMAFAGMDLSPLKTELLNRTEEDNGTAGDMMDISAIEQLTGNKASGLAWQSKAFETCRVFASKEPDKACKRVLVYAATADIGGNTPIEFLLEGSDFEPVFYYPNVTNVAVDDLPDHDVAFCAAPVDAKECVEFSKLISRLTLLSGTKALNVSSHSRTLDRLYLASLLSDVPGAFVPTTVQIDRKALESTLGDQGAYHTASRFLTFPFVIRPIGSHAGFGLSKINSPHALATYLTERLETSFYLSEFVDYATPADQKYRKYRIVFVDGLAYPCHMAIAEQWDVWYLNAGMHLNIEKRLEEAAFMEGFTAQFGARHRDALADIAARIGLDYFGIDCAEDAQGNLVVFEADNALIVHDMDPRDVYPYKHHHMQAIFAAFGQLLLQKSRADVVHKPTRGCA
ncbi:MAG: RimK family alpha-L-glutamate ligase [Roseobacter sp.]